MRGLLHFGQRPGPVWWAATLALCLAAAVNCAASSGESTNGADAPAARTRPLKDVLPSAQWHRVEQSVDHALAWLASQQNADGSFPSTDQAQPAVTSLCVLAFLSRGHQAGVGPYGAQINRAVDYVLSCQQPDGAFSRQVPEPSSGGQSFGPIARAGGYNHPFAGLMLGEVYGQVKGEREQKVKAGIEKALNYSRALQTRSKPGMEGGYRYLNMDSSDLSCTVCELMFLRSARNAEFDIPQQYIDEALAYVRRSADANTGIFYYQPTAMRSGMTVNITRTLTNANGTIIHINPSPNTAVSRGIIAGGIVALSMGGQHQTDVALAGGEYLLSHPVTEYGERYGSEHFFYTAYYCSQAAAILGGKFWEGLFPPLADAFLDAQSPDGSWPPEPASGDRVYGNNLTTAMAVLTLTTPFELLPVVQR